MDSVRICATTAPTRKRDHSLSQIRHRKIHRRRFFENIWWCSGLLVHQKGFIHIQSFGRRRRWKGCYHVSSITRPHSKPALQMERRKPWKHPKVGFFSHLNYLKRIIYLFQKNSIPCFFYIFQIGDFPFSKAIPNWFPLKNSFLDAGRQRWLSYRNWWRWHHLQMQRGQTLNREKRGYQGTLERLS